MGFNDIFSLEAFILSLDVECITMLYFTSTSIRSVLLHPRTIKILYLSLGLPTARCLLSFISDYNKVHKRKVSSVTTSYIDNILLSSTTSKKYSLFPVLKVLGANNWGAAIQKAIDNKDITAVLYLHNICGYSPFNIILATIGTGNVNMVKAALQLDKTRVSGKELHLLQEAVDRGYRDIADVIMKHYHMVTVYSYIL